MPTTSSRGGRCIQLLSCWTGCFGNILPCLTAKPIQPSLLEAEPIINTSISMPTRFTFTTNEEYLLALEKWKTDSIRVLTTHMQTSSANGTLTPEAMQRITGEIERINLATGSAVAIPSAPPQEDNTRNQTCTCCGCFGGVARVCCCPCNVCKNKCCPRGPAPRQPELPEHRR